MGFAFAFGVPLGLASGYFGGGVDNLMMRLVDAFLTFPPLLLAVALVGLLGPDIQNVMLALGLVQAPILARMVRGSTLAVREEVYVTAPPRTRRGAGPHRPLPRAAQHDLADRRAAHGGLFRRGRCRGVAFLPRLRTQPPNPSWGRDMSEARRYLSDAPWMFIAPTAMIALCVLSINFMGEACGTRSTPAPGARGRRVSGEG